MNMSEITNIEISKSQAIYLRAVLNTGGKALMKIGKRPNAGWKYNEWKAGQLMQMAKIIDKKLKGKVKKINISNPEELKKFKQETSGFVSSYGFPYRLADFTDIAAEAKEALCNSIWHRANGDYLPPKDKPVIVLIQHDYMERTDYAVSFAHIIDANLYAGSKYIPKDYNGWNIPDVKYWLDLDLPKEK